MREDDQDASIFLARSQRGITATNICNKFDQEYIARILRLYLDKTWSQNILDAIVHSHPLRSTSDPVHTVLEVIPNFLNKDMHMGLITTMEMVLQSLRILVIEEDADLE